MQINKILQNVPALFAGHRQVVSLCPEHSTPESVCIAGQSGKTRCVPICNQHVAKNNNVTHRKAHHFDSVHRWGLQLKSEQYTRRGNFNSVQLDGFCEVQICMYLSVVCLGASLQLAPSASWLRRNRMHPVYSSPVYGPVCKWNTNAPNSRQPSVDGDYADSIAG